MPRRGGRAGVEAVHLRVMSEFGFSLGRWRDTSGDVQRPSPLVYPADGDATALAVKESWKQSFGRLSSAPRLDGVHGRVEGKAHHGAQDRQRHHGGAMHARCTMDEDSVLGIVQGFQNKVNPAL